MGCRSMEKKRVSLLEASIVLLLMLIVMGLGVIKFGISPQTPVMLVMGILTIWARAR